MKLYTIETGKFKLDGGAMFGVVPKSIWSRTNPADSQNRIEMAMRCLLIEDESRLVLIDTGIGHKYNQKFQGLYDIDHSVTLEKSLEKLGYNREDITDVILTHLHFDHCGGTTEWNPNKERHELVFENAIHWVQRQQLGWAMNPNPREKASFFPENIQPLVANGNLRMLEGETELFPDVHLRVFNGHTEAQQLPLLYYKGSKILFAGDVFPSFGHIPLPYVMGYDTRPLLTLSERESLLPQIVEENIVLFYEHDPYHECGTIKRNEKGGYQSDTTFPLTDLG